MPDPDVSISEACALLNVGQADLQWLLCGPNNPELAERVTVRQLLAVKVAFSLLPAVNLQMAVQAGVTAANGATAGGGRLLVVEWSDKEPRALWRDAGAGFNVAVPILAVPADAWLAGLTEIVAEHRAVAARPN